MAFRLAPPYGGLLVGVVVYVVGCVPQQAVSSMSTLTYKGDLNVCLRFVSPETLEARRQAAGVGGGDISPSRTGTLGSQMSTSSDRGGELQVVVKQARNLTAVRSNGFSDPFCKWSVQLSFVVVGGINGRCCCCIF